MHIRSAFGRDFIPFITIIIIDMSKYLLLFLFLFFFVFFGRLLRAREHLHTKELDFRCEFSTKPIAPTRRRDMPLSSSPSVDGTCPLPISHPIQVYRFTANRALAVCALFVHFHCSSICSATSLLQNDVVVRFDWLRHSITIIWLLFLFYARARAPVFRIREHRHYALHMVLVITSIGSQDLYE